MSTGSGSGVSFGDAGALLSFEGPRPGTSSRPVSRRTLKTAQLAKQESRRDHRVRVSRKTSPASKNHRQDIKGTWWMPWHQESMKGVDGCDKPR